MQWTLEVFSVFLCVCVCIQMACSDKKRWKWKYFSGETAEITKSDGHFIFSCRLWSIQPLRSPFPQQLLSEVFTICCLLPVTSLNPYPSSQIQWDMCTDVTKVFQRSQWKGIFPLEMLCGKEGLWSARPYVKHKTDRWNDKKQRRKWEASPF